MSSILEALRKLERDKLHHPGGTPQIAADLLRPAVNRRSLPLVTLTILALLLVAVPLLWWWRSTAPPLSAAVPPLPGVIAPARPSVPPPTRGERASFEVLAPAPAPAASPVQAPIAPPAAAVVAPPSPVARQQPVVSAIIYTAGRAERLAVIDGSPAMEGTDIAGVRVEEILSDRVIFTEHGTRFYVPLSP